MSGSRFSAGTSPTQSRPITRRRAIKALAAVGILAGTAALATRIHHVAATSPQPPQTVTHAMGEWFALDGAFLEEANERTQGYSMRVGGARLCSYNEFVSSYVNDGSSPLHISKQETAELLGIRVQDVGDGLDTPALICLDIDVAREGGDGQEETDGHLLLDEMHLIPRRGNEYLRSNAALFNRTIENYHDSDNPRTYVQLKENTEFSIHVPYRHWGAFVMTDEHQLNKAFVKPVMDSEFLLVASNTPVRHVINVLL